MDIRYFAHQTATRVGSDLETLKKKYFPTTTVNSPAKEKVVVKDSNGKIVGEQG